MNEIDSISEADDQKKQNPIIDLNEDTSLNEYSLSSTDYGSNLSPEDLDTIDQSLSSVCSNNSPENVMPNGYTLSSVSCFDWPIMNREETGGGVEEFYKKYKERMRWFDVLSHDRTSGISAILNKKLAIPGSIDNIEPVDISFPHILWSKMARKRLLKSLESDFELVYVAQSCLSWEALHHQYTKVEALLQWPSSQDSFFNKNVAAEFQKFQVLLERFMEDERCEGKRVWNYVRRRFSLNSLLQVPDVPGFLEDAKGEGVSVKEVLEAIEKSIHAFWVFVNTDNKNTWWKFSNLAKKSPPVADPRDLELLANLTKQLRKNEVWLKDVRKKKRCWLKGGVSSVEEGQRKDILFTVIEMKLVSRVLQMPMVSSSQLKWCQNKLNNIYFRNGNLKRVCFMNPLFPP